MPRCIMILIFIFMNTHFCCDSYWLEILNHWVLIKTGDAILCLATWSTSFHIQEVLSIIPLCLVNCRTTSPEPFDGICLRIARHSGKHNRVVANRANIVADPIKPKPRLVQARCEFSGCHACSPDTCNAFDWKGKGYISLKQRALLRCPLLIFYQGLG